MKKILLPTDFSDNSLNAIDYAMRFFENWECEFYILNVQKVSEYISDDLMMSSSSETIFDSIATDNKKQVNTLAKELEKKYVSKSYRFHGLFDYDNFVSAVEQAVNFHQIDLIIMGTNGATGASEVVFGSNTLRVLRNIKCPTLTIPNGYAFNGIKRALFSTHGCKDFSFEGVKIFKELLDIHQCELHVLELDSDSTITSKKNDNACLQALFPEHRYAYFCVQTTPGLKAINTVNQLLKIDLHTAFIEKENFLYRLLNGSETSKLAYGTHIPLLFLHK